MTWQVACDLAEVGELPLGVQVGDLDVAIVRIGDEVFAIRDECSHGHVQLSEGDLDAEGCAIECYLHGSMFDLRTGASHGLPATDPVPVYPVRLDGTQVLVDIGESDS